MITEIETTGVQPKPETYSGYIREGYPSKHKTVS